MRFGTIARVVGASGSERKDWCASLQRVILSTLVVLFLAEPAMAIPAFARRYKLPCHFCHDGFPKLSVIGEQFKERGFRMQQETFDLNDWLESVPVILRTRVNVNFVEDDETNTSGFFKLVTAGNLGSRVSYWFDQIWTATEDDFDRFGTDNAWGQVEVIPRRFYVKGGRLELDLPFSQARTPHPFAYDIYFENTGFESDNIGQHQDGAEVGGFFDRETRWSVALVKGRNSGEAERLADKADRFDGNFFARFARRSGENRVGAFAYVGRNVLARQNPDPGRGGAPVLVWDDDLLRFGADGSAYLGQLHVYGVFLHGRNDNSIANAENPEGTGETLTFTGGFLQGDYSIQDGIIFSARLNLVSRPPRRTNLPHETFVGFFPGLKLYFHTRFRLLFEIGFQNQDRPTLGAIQAELAL